MKMKFYHVRTIPNFDNHFRNTSYDCAERIYNDAHISKLVRTIRALTPRESQEWVFFDICNRIAEHTGSAHVFAKDSTPEAGERDGMGRVRLVNRDASPSYENTHVVGYLCHQPDEIVQTLALRARDIFTEQGFRLHLFAFSLHQTKMRTFAFARYGACSSDEFDVVMNPVRFVRTLASFLQMNKEELGYDPTHLVRTDGTRTLTMPGTSLVYQLDSCVYSSSKLADRATSVWSATTSHTGERVIIKDCWQRADRKEEGDMQKQALTSESPIFPEEDNLEIAPQQHHVTEWPMPARFPLYVAHETVRCNDSGLDEQAALGNGSPFIHEHRRVVVKQLECKRIEDLDSHLDLFTAVRDCVDGHWALYRAGVLHRDVSKDNLMVAVKNNELDFGFLVDLDVATDADLPTRIACEAPLATGNKQFMARELLRWLGYSKNQSSRTAHHGNPHKRRRREPFPSGFRQEYRHDLEYFYWVLLWCLFQMDQSENENMTNTFDQWAVGNFYAILNDKKNFFSLVRSGDIKLEGISPSELTKEAFSDQLVSLSEVLEDTNALKKLRPEELYYRFQRGLTGIIEFLREN